MIKHESVDSSTINTIGYDAEKKELHVAFHNTGTYIYSDVSPEKHQALMEAESPGSHHHQNIRGAHAHRKS